MPLRRCVRAARMESSYGLCQLWKFLGNALLRHRGAQRAFAATRQKRVNVDVRKREEALPEYDGADGQEIIDGSAARAYCQRLQCLQHLLKYAFSMKDGLLIFTTSAIFNMC